MELRRISLKLAVRDWNQAAAKSFFFEEVSRLPVTPFEPFLASNRLLSGPVVQALIVILSLFWTLLVWAAFDFCSLGTTKSLITCFR